MSQTKFLKPKDGLTVVNPETGSAIKSEGEALLMSKYLRRRIAEGDLVVASAPKPQKDTSRKKKEK